MADDIETVCKRMVTDANTRLEQYEKDQTKKGVKDVKSMRVFISQAGRPKLRTGDEQAVEVLAGRAGTCNAPEMIDATRDVGPQLDGKNLADLNALKKAVSKEDYAKFIAVYGAAMKKQGLRNAKGGTDFLSTSADALQMQLANARLPETDPQLEKCRLAYAKATREDGKPKNKEYEGADKKWLATYDKAHPQPAGKDAGGFAGKHGNVEYESGGMVISLPPNPAGKFPLVVLFAGTTHIPAVYGQTPPSYFKKAILVFAEMSGSFAKAEAELKPVLAQNKTQISTTTICGYSGGGPATFRDSGQADKAIGYIDATTLDGHLAKLNAKSIFSCNPDNWDENQYANVIAAQKKAETRMNGGFYERTKEKHSTYPNYFLKKFESKLM